MGTRYVPRADQPRVRLLAVGLLTATLVISSVAVFASTLRLESSAGEAAEMQPRGGYGPGYPLHGGLAGPTPVREVNHAGHYAAGYPLHGGLAGPSRVQTPSVSVWTYPHGGFAGPSQVGEGD